MSIFKKLLNGVTGGFVSTAVDTFKEYFPADMSPEQKADLALKTKQLEANIQQQMDDAAITAEEVLTNRIAQLEGTASDLKGIPFVGPLVLFLRGLQRPLWGYATLFMDYMWFSEWTTLTSKQESALMAINILVLGFLFGERAIKNVMPLITKLFEAKTKA
ncbi:hypothetical protein A8139_05530 [Marinomonas primoryensis]|uniref:Coil containing protein n=1 Tax=Marinomonas primoryensis TaxID=178399 RepID=A0A2Z4PPS0_9GAMM|nr:hypothetical protein [Marinomonas primoryensis]AWX99511.1 hypothetical protein A8139_05530 [Marinomonas primoryensis]